MITLDSFGEKKKEAVLALDTINALLAGLLKQEASLSLVAQADDKTLDRMSELEKEVFSIEDNVYSKEDIIESLAEEYSLLMLLKINNKIEGYVFGYDDDPENPNVEGTEYFIDSALVSLRYEHLGIGTMLSGVVLLLLYLLGFKKIGITTEEKDKTGRELVKFYKKLGFTEAATSLNKGEVGMKIILDTDLIDNIVTKLNISKLGAKK